MILSGSHIKSYVVQNFISGLLLLVNIFLINSIRFGEISQISTLLSFLIFFVASSLFNEPDRRVNCSLYFNLYTLLALIMAYSQYKSIGTYFLGGGDDEFFWNASRMLATNGFDFNTTVDSHSLAIVPYKAYLLINAGFLHLLNLLGFQNVSFFNLILLKCFIGSLVPFLTFRLFSAFVDEVTIRKFLPFIAVINPTLIYTITLIRDSWLVFFFLLQINILLSNQRLIFKFLLLSALVLIVVNFRPFHALIFVIYLVSYFFFSVSSKNGRLISILLFIITAFFLFANAGKILNRSSSETSESYLQLSNQTSSDESIGRNIINLPGPVGIFAKSVYVSLSPVPPPIVYGLSFKAIIISLGQVAWYFVLIVFIFSWRKIIKIIPNRSFVLSLYVTFLVTIVALSMSSMEPRHLQFIYPVIFALAFIYLYSDKKSFWRYKKFFSFTVLLALAMYLIVKIAVSG